jgi:hypothetical protein
MAVLRLVIASVRPGAGEGRPVELEVRTQIDGLSVPPVFSNAAALVREVPVTGHGYACRGEWLHKSAMPGMFVWVLVRSAGSCK